MGCGIGTITFARRGTYGRIRSEEGADFSLATNADIRVVTRTRLPGGYRRRSGPARRLATTAAERLWTLSLARMCCT